jgi:hypothetical protein
MLLEKLVLDPRRLLSQNKVCFPIRQGDVLFDNVTTRDEAIILSILGKHVIVCCRCFNLMYQIWISLIGRLTWILAQMRALNLNLWKVSLLHVAPQTCVIYYSTKHVSPHSIFPITYSDYYTLDIRDLMPRTVPAAALHQDEVDYDHEYTYGTYVLDQCC